MLKQTTGCTGCCKICDLIRVEQELNEKLQDFKGTEKTHEHMNNLIGVGSGITGTIKNLIAFD